MSDRRSNKNRTRSAETHKKVSVFVAVIFFGFIVLADVVLLFSHSRVMSENENRMLQQAPVLNADRLSSGKFMEEFEDFVSDQFIGRDGWISARLRLDRATGRKESNGMYLGAKGYLFEAASEPDEEKVTASINAINRFASRHSGLNIAMSVVPNALSVMKELFPAGAPTRDQLEDIDNIRAALASDVNFVSVYDALRAHAGEELYYKGDHHWTSLGAKYAFDEIAPYIGITDPHMNWQVMQVADNFTGTLSSTSGSFATADTIEIYVPDVQTDYYIEYSGDPVKYSSIYSSQALEEKNKYEVFMGGNHPKALITTMNETGRNLLLLKDSYANCFIQFLLPFYDRILVVDPRYYSDDLNTDIEENNITDVLILYNANTFLQDNSLAGVLEPEV